MIDFETIYHQNKGTLKYLLVLLVLLSFLLGAAKALAQTGSFTEVIDGNSSNVTALTNWGRTGANTHQYAIKWVPTVSSILCSVYVDIGKQSGGSTGDVEVHLVDGGATPAAGDIIDTAFYLNAEIGDGLPKDFGTCHPLTAGNTYWIELDRTSGWAESPNALTAVQGTENSESELWQCASGSPRCSSGEWTVSGASPAEIHFTLYGSQDQSFFDEYTSSSYPFGDPDFGWFGNSMRDVLKYLFVPPVALWDAVDGIKTEILTNVPLGYVSTVQALWVAQSVNTSTDFGLDLNGQTIPIFSSSTEVEHIGENWNRLQLGLAAFAWVAFAAYIISRVQHLDL